MFKAKDRSHRKWPRSPGGVRPKAIGDATGAIDKTNSRAVGVNPIMTGQPGSISEV